MHKIKKDIEKNRLCITLSGILTLEEAKKIKGMIEVEINSLQPGFDLINDISKFILGHDETGNILKEIMLLLIEKKVNRVVRVIGTSKTGLIQFANNSLPIESYKLSYVPTLEEAENILDHQP